MPDLGDLNRPGAAARPPRAGSRHRQPAGPGGGRAAERALGKIVILGPQRFRPTVAAALDSLGVRGPVALITAGWQEREGEDRELLEHIGRPAVNLRLYERHDEVLARDAELARALRRRQDRLHRLQELYRLRLDRTLEAARAVLLAEGPLDLLRFERRSAIRAVRTLDGGHLRRLRMEHAVFDDEWRPAEREAVAAQRREIVARLDDCDALLVAGGHVAVLLNRMRLFDVPALAQGRPIVAWSAGAMALSAKVVLFHDHPPQGAGNAEVLETGLCAFRTVLPFPHARRRLRLSDPVRVSLLARRFAPATCVALDDESRVDCAGERCVAAAGTLRLHVRGALVQA